MKKLIVLGLGYVGLPLAYNFAKSKKIETIGFDVSEEKINELKSGIDRTNQVGQDIDSVDITLTSDPSCISEADYIVVAVPTPTKDGVPDLFYIDSASKLIGQYIKKGSIVIYESTVFPKCTEEFSAPIIQKVSGLKLNQDFGIGYSPERINPGDTTHTVDKITKIVSGSTPEVLKKIEELYLNIVPEVFPVESIAIAEAAKVLENSQRDLNIALLNQFAMLYPDVPVNKVVDAMNTKWNSLGFRPGLVGGHCIAEDPYYLIDSTKKRGKKFTLLEESRRINEELSKFISEEIFQATNLEPKNNKILMCGITYKENINDIRNSKLINLYKDIKKQCDNVDIYDPLINVKRFEEEYGITAYNNIDITQYNVIIIGVKHDAFNELLDDLYSINPDNANNIIIFDIPLIFKNSQIKNKFIYRVI